jgi:hypothetical protein
MAPTFSERKQQARAQFKRDFRNDRIAEGLCQRDVASALDIVNSHAHSLEDEDGPKNLTADSIALLPEGLAIRTVRRILDRLKTRFELVRSSEDDVCGSEMENFAKVAKEYSEAIAVWSAAMADGIVDDHEAERIDSELAEAEESIRVARRSFAGRRAKQRDGRSTPVNVRNDRGVAQASALKTA